MIKKMIFTLFTMACVTKLIDNDADIFFSKSYAEEKRIITKKFDILEATKHLERACNIAETIQNQIVRDSIAYQLKYCLNCLKFEVSNKNYEAISNEIMNLQENLGEILADCQDINIKNDITTCVNAMIK